MTKKKKLIYFGSDPLGLLVLKYLNKEFDLKLVITSPSKKQGRGQKEVRPNQIGQFAKDNQIPVFSPLKLDNQTASKINQVKTDFMLVFAYGKIIPLNKLKCQEILNIHPSLLPQLRGPAPIRYTILQGLRETGISLMKIDQKIDHGPVIDQINFPLDDRETYSSLREKVKQGSIKLIRKSLAKYLSGQLKAKEQDHSKATFSKFIKKKDGQIDWDQPIKKIDQKIRAFNPWPGTYTLTNGKRLKILSATPQANKLKLGKVQLEGKKEMDFQQFQNGYQKKLDFSEKVV